MSNVVENNQEQLKNAMQDPEIQAFIGKHDLAQVIEEWDEALKNRSLIERDTVVVDGTSYCVGVTEEMLFMNKKAIVYSKLPRSAIYKPFHKRKWFTEIVTGDNKSLNRTLFNDDLEKAIHIIALFSDDLDAEAFMVARRNKALAEDNRKQTDAYKIALLEAGIPEKHANIMLTSVKRFLDMGLPKGIYNNIIHKLGQHPMLACNLDTRELDAAYRLVVEMTTAASEDVRSIKNKWITPSALTGMLRVRDSYPPPVKRVKEEMHNLVSGMESNEVVFLSKMFVVLYGVLTGMTYNEKVIEVKNARKRVKRLHKQHLNRRSRAVSIIGDTNAPKDVKLDEAAETATAKLKQVLDPVPEVSEVSERKTSIPVQPKPKRSKPVVDLTAPEEPPAKQKRKSSGVQPSSLGTLGELLGNTGDLDSVVSIDED